MHRIGVIAQVIALLSIVMAWETTTIAEERQDLPPIECPLRKAGIDRTTLKPFEEVEEQVPGVHAQSHLERRVCGR